jgi:FkbM family methyltransferase
MKRILSQFRRNVFEYFGSGRYSKPGLNGLDDLLAEFLNYRHGCFIEVGANNGFSQSNTYYLERLLGWSGVLIEGIPMLYEACRKLRTRSHVFNCALVAADYPLPFVEMHFANLMSVVEGSMGEATRQADHLRKGLEVQKLDKTYTVQVPARTLTSVLDEVPSLAPIDFLSLDVEGYELQVLKGLDLAKYQPRYILVECNFWEDIDRYLAPHYSLVKKMTHHDYFYQRRTELS